ncbi:MAG: DUF4154 domain-containing protein [Bacteroidales bacterium]|nr:DUF4154 domain-containing protein [Bacteroidales bacterium]
MVARKFGLLLFFVFCFAYRVSPVIILGGTQISEAKVKAALIVNFAQNVQWRNESSIGTYRIGVIDQDSSVYKELLAVKGVRQIKGKPFDVFYLSGSVNYADYNLLYFGFNLGDMLPSVYRKINQKDVLVITDRSADRVLTMINILFNAEKNTFSFEINKQNLDANGFSVNPKILLLGGDYVNIKELYVQTSEQLRRETERINQYKDELVKISREKEEYQQEINGLNDRIDGLAKGIKQSEQEYALLDSKLKGRDSLLAVRTQELERKIHESQSLQELIKSQMKSIENASSKLDSLDSEISIKQIELSTKQAQIEQQTAEISQQDTIILDQQRRFLIALLVTLGLTLSLGFAYWAYRMKLNLNQKLERLVAQRTDELQTSQQYFKSLFENSPIPLFELDLSALKSFVETIDYLHKMPHIDNAEALKVTGQGLALIQVINVNQAGLDLFGFKDKQDAAQNYFKTYSMELSTESFKTVFFAMIERQSSCAYESIRQNIRGSLLHVHLKWMVLPGYEDTYKRVLLTISDITKLKNYQDELSRHKDHLEELVYDRTNEIVALNQGLTAANAELQKKAEELSQIIQVLKETQDQLVQSEKMASLGMLTAGIAHEINNPVNYISGSYQALQMHLDDMWALLEDVRKGSGDPAFQSVFDEVEQRHNSGFGDLYESMKFLLSNIETGINRTTEIIRSLMAFSRNEPQEFRPFDVPKGVKDVLVILKSKYSGRIDIVEEYAPDLPMIFCNVNGINQVLMNLISNAIDSIHEQGRILISSKYSAETDELVIRVKDSGCGIDDAILDKIFDPFFTTKDVGRGTGLGLYISYNMVKAHNGTIEVTSRVGEGSTFTVRLPVGRKSPDLLT